MTAISEKRLVRFPLVKDGSSIVYPDDISLFSKTEISGESIIGYYSGQLDLEIYEYPITTIPNWIPIYHFYKRFPDAAQMIIFSVNDSDVMAGLTMEQRMVFRTFVSQMNALPSRQTEDGNYAQMIDLNDQDTINGVGYISTVTWNGDPEPLLTPEQVQEILA